MLLSIRFNYRQKMHTIDIKSISMHISHSPAACRNSGTCPSSIYPEAASRMADLVRRRVSRRDTLHRSQADLIATLTFPLN